MNKGITRRDFLNGALLGAGALLLDLPAPLHLLARSDWDGYGGTGDYAPSHGNTEEVVRYAHAMRDGRYDTVPKDVTDTRELFDLVIIGGGLSGLGAAYQFTNAGSRGGKCLIIENHPVFGGEAKRNEFVVSGQKLIGPQGSNSFVVIDDPDATGHELYAALGIPRRFRYGETRPPFKQLHFDHTNYGFMLWHDNAPNSGYFFEDKTDARGTRWVFDMWRKKLSDAPFPEKVRRDLTEWRESRKKYYNGGDFQQWLDTMTYKDYIEKIMGLSPEVTRFVDPVLAASMGLGADAISAFGAYQVSMPGFQAFSGGFAQRARSEDSEWHSFPGGNDGFVRYFVKALISGAIGGTRSFEDILNQHINFDALDRSENTVSIRLGALAVRIEHSAAPGTAEFVQVTYVKGGRLYRLKGRSVVMASGSWVSRRIVKDLPEDYKEAYRHFHRSPVLVVNVALTNWNFLYKLGITACRWFRGFGFSCNIRRPMVVGNYWPPLDPDKPALITFYAPFYYPGLAIREQGAKGRRELLSTSYASYESQILDRMSELFGSAGFDPKRDIAGIVLNRWGHAYVNPQPGFYFGKNGMPAPSSIIRKRFGRIAFAHSELNGHQHWLGAVEEGRRAVRQVLSID